MKKHHKWIVAVAIAIGGGIMLYATRLGDDDEIAEQAVAALNSHPAVDAGGLRVSVEDGVVTIIGQLPNNESRRIAVEEVRKVRGVNRVIDKIEIEVDAAD